MKKKMLIILIVVIVVVLVAVAGFVYYEKQQENILIEEVNRLSSLDITEDEIDMNIKSSGNYGVVERKIKEYLNQYAVYSKEITSIMEDEQLSKVLTAQNYTEDGPEFTETKEYLASTKQNFSEKMQELIEMTSEESIMKYVEEENLSERYVNLYRNLMFDDEILKDLQEAETTLEEVSKKINELIGIEEEIIELLVNNKDKWVVEGDQIQFTSRTVLEEYNELVEKLSSLE